MESEQRFWSWYEIIEFLPTIDPEKVEYITIRRDSEGWFVLIKVRE